MAVVCTIFVLPGIMFAELILVPGFAVWLSMFEQFDDSLMDLIIAKPDNYTTMVRLLVGRVESLISLSSFQLFISLNQIPGIVTFIIPSRYISTSI